jgi:hypothetical protein
VGIKGLFIPNSLIKQSSIFLFPDNQVYKLWQQKSHNKHMRINEQIVLAHWILISHSILKVVSFETVNLNTSQATYMAVVTVGNVG